MQLECLSPKALITKCVEAKRLLSASEHVLRIAVDRGVGSGGGLSSSFASLTSDSVCTHEQREQQ
jgi:hypothetical protein